MSVCVELSQSLWRPADCLTIFKALNDVLFKQLGYRGNSQGYYNVDNSFIDKVSLTSNTSINTMLQCYLSNCILYVGVTLPHGHSHHHGDSVRGSGEETWSSMSACQLSLTLFTQVETAAWVCSNRDLDPNVTLYY